MVPMSNIGLSTTISNTTQIRPQLFSKFMCVHWECAWCYCQILVFTPPYPTLYTNWTTALQKVHVCPLGMSVVLVPNISFSTTIFNNTQIRLQYFRKFRCVHWECAWCYYQILVLAPTYPTLHKYTYNTSVNSCVTTGNVRGDNGKFGLSTTISNTTQIHPKHFRKFMCFHWECAWC